MIQLIIWILFCGAEGVRDGGSLSHGNSKYPFNIHKFYMPVRIIVACSLAYWAGGLWWCGLHIIVYILTFSFPHNGMYYETRERIDVPEYNFDSNSTTSTAKFELNFKERTTAFIIGILIFSMIWYFQH